MPAEREQSRWRWPRAGGMRGPALLWAAVLVAVLAWPTLTRSGYLIGHDMVFGLRSPITAADVGAGSAAPRAVPVDLYVALLERVVGGAVLGRIAVVAALLTAGLGARELLRTRSLPGTLAVVSAAVWNPYVVERLAIGQWALLWGYAALPWALVAVLRGRGRTGLLGLAVALVAASITPTGGAVVAATTVAVALAARRRPLATLLIAAAFQAPWILGGLASSASSTSAPAGAAAFSARSEHPGGALLTLLGGGGIWNADVVPASRSGAAAWFGLLLVVIGAVVGWSLMIRRLGARAVSGLVAVGGAGFLVALASVTPGLEAGLRAAVAHLPGGGLLRDSQKWLLPMVLLQALLLGAAAERVALRLRRRAAPVARTPVVLALAAVTACLPLLVLPDAAATLRPTLTPARIPSDWHRVADRLSGPGDTVTVPFQAYRAFAWVPAVVVADPAPSLLPGTTVVDDRLSVSGVRLPGEDPRAAQIARALDGSDLPGRLARLGVGWVVVERRTPGAVPDLQGLTRVYLGPDLALYRVPGPITDAGPSGARIAVGVAGVLIAALTGLGLAGGAARERWWGRRGPTRSGRMRSVP